MEHWKSIKDYEGLYEVSNMGRIKSLQRTDKRGKTVNERILKPCTDRCGYLLVNLFKDGKGTKTLIHRLVAEAFIENPNNHPVINHKDEDPSNNTVYNLEWTTHSINNNYRSRKGWQTKRFGKKVAQYNLDGELIQIWSSTREAEREKDLITGQLVPVAEVRKRPIITLFGTISKKQVFFGV
jgi:hypothetical protein